MSIFFPFRDSYPPRRRRKCRVILPTKHESITENFDSIHAASWLRSDTKRANITHKTVKSISSKAQTRFSAASRCSLYTVKADSKRKNAVRRKAITIIFMVISVFSPFKEPDWAFY
jgi:hypothetical protein